MKLNKLTYLAIAALAAGSMTSCDDYLDKAPDERVQLDSKEKLSLIMVNGYMSSNYSAICEFSGDNIVDNNSPDDNGMRYNLTWRDAQDVEAFSWENIKSNMSDDSPSEVWAEAWHAIAVCNSVLEAAQDLIEKGQYTADELAAVRGEALVSRAYHHFVLANIFAMPYAGPELSTSIPAIPYMTKTEDRVLVNYERESLQSVYEHIEADLLAAIPLIDDASYVVPKYHFNKKATYAFAARFYLFQRRYKEALAYATLAFGGMVDENLNVTDYGTPVLRTFWTKTFTSIDAIVSAYCSADEASNYLLVTTYSVYNRRRGGRFAINRDAKQAAIYGNGPTWNTSFTHYYPHPCYAGKIYIRGSQEYGCFFPKSYEFFEYTDKVAGIGYPHIVRCEFTAEETLLCRAEARCFLGDLEGAIADLSIWDKNRQNIPNIQVDYPELTQQTIDAFYATDELAGGNGVVKPLNIDRVCPSADYTVTPDKVNILQCVLHFRRMETVDDGYRWFDIKRYGLEITHKIGMSRVENLVWNDPRRALQIPPEVIAAGFKPNDRFPSDGSGDATQVSNEDLMAK